MATIDIAALTRSVEAVVRDPKVSTQSTGNVELDKSVEDLRCARLDGEYAAHKTLGVW